MDASRRPSENSDAGRCWGADASAQEAAHLRADLVCNQGEPPGAWHLKRRPFSRKHVRTLGETPCMDGLVAFVLLI
eukprot:15434765-Alexandrium_andersonii.AAC.2